MSDEISLEEVVEIASDPAQLRKRVEQVGELFYNGDVGAHAEVEATPNLNALAIGLGIKNVAYEPQVFPGLLYRMDIGDEKQVTLIICPGGHLTVVDAPSAKVAKESILTAVERMQQLDLYESAAVARDEIEITETEVDPVQTFSSEETS